MSGHLTPPKHVIRWLVGVAAVAVGWLSTPQPVPIYDGLGLPDEPYRYAVAPAGTRHTPPPTGARDSLQIGGGRSTAGLTLQTREVAPQFTVFLPLGSLVTERGPLAVSVEPVGTQVVPGVVADGNSYRLTITGPTPVRLDDPDLVAHVLMRATTQRRPQPDIYFRPSARRAWQHLATTAAGLDVRSARLSGTGDYQLAGAPAEPASSRATVWAAGAGGVLVLIAGSILTIRRTGERRPKR